MRLSLESHDGDVYRVRCEGPVNLDLASPQSNPLEDLVGTEAFKQTILLDLEGTHTMTSTGVAWLVRCHQQCAKAGGRLILHSVPPMIHHVLKLLNIDRILHIAPDAKTALARIQETQ